MMWGRCDAARIEYNGSLELGHHADHKGYPGTSDAFRISGTADIDLCVPLPGRTRLQLAQAESLAERARALEKGETGILRVGATPQVIAHTRAPLLRPYRRRHHGV